jgi:NAD(P)-dependent dehydrogenase (short-subunit alcohol dehydrogenase family)
VAEIRAAGGQAVASTADVAEMAGAQAVLATALDRYGEVHALVNNAGVLRDRMFVNMTEQEWDDVIRGQLRATFCPARVFAGHWRDQARAAKGGGADSSDTVIVNVSSTSGLLGQAGQTNYGAAKAGIAALTLILAEEVARYGIRVNAITPVARTRMTENLPGIGELMAAPDDPAVFDVYHPGNVSPLVAWLVGAGCPATGRIFYAKGGEIRQFLGWGYGKVISKGSRWSVAELDREMGDLV